MKNSKRLISIILSLAMVMQVMIFAPFAMAEEEEAQISVFEQIRNETNLVANSSFEDKFDIGKESEETLNFYDYRFKNGNNPSYRAETKEAYSGEKSLFFSHTGGNDFLTAYVNVTGSNTTFITSLMALGTVANKPHWVGNSLANGQWEPRFALSLCATNSGVDVSEDKAVKGDTSKTATGTAYFPINLLYSAAANSDAQGAKAEKSEWKRMYSTIEVKSTDVQVIGVGVAISMQNSTVANPETGKYLELYTDDYYIGELMIADVNYTGETEVTVPANGNATVELSAEAFNQIENKAGIENTEFTYELVGEPAGASITDDVLTLTNEAEEGTIQIKITAIPDFHGADTQGEEITKYRTKIVDIAVAKAPAIDDGGNGDDDEDDDIIDDVVDEDAAYFESIRNATNRCGSGNMESKDLGDTEPWEDYFYFSPSTQRSNTYAITDKQVYNGSKSFLTHAKNSYTNESHFPGFSILKGKTLVASAMVLGTKANAEAVALKPDAQIALKFGYYVASGYFYRFEDFITSGFFEKKNPVLLSEMLDAPASTEENQQAASKNMWKMVHSAGFYPSEYVAPLGPWAYSVGVVSTGKDVEYYVDDYYVGELIVAKVKNSTPETIYLPIEREKTVELTAEAYNQLGTNDYFGDDSTYTWEAVSLPEGVTLEDGKLKVLRTATPGEAKLKVTFNPTFKGAAEQTAEQKATRTANVTLKIEKDPNAPKEPIVEDVVLSGIVSNGLSLSVDYDYYQVDGEDDASVINWYKKLPEDEDWGEPFLTGTKATAGSYTVKTEDESYYLRVGVVPTTDSTPVYTSEEVFSNEASKPTAPEARNIKIKGLQETDKEWEATFDFYDLNYGDEPDELNHKYQWYIYDEKTDEYTAIEGETTNKYTIRPEDADKYISVGIIAVSLNAPEYDLENEAFSEPRLSSATPSVSNIEIEKTSNSYITVTYDYNHPFEVAEGDTVIEWYKGNTLIGEGAKLRASNYNGDTLTVKITPIAEKKPYKGKTVEEDYKVSIKSTGGGSGSPGGSGPVFKPEKPIVVAPQPTTLKNVPDWAKAEVDFVIANKIMEPVTEDDFAGSDFIDRKEFMSVILRAAGIEKSDYRGEFGDVSSMDSFSGLLQAAVDKNIISKNDLFYPDRSLTRDEMCKIIVASITASTNAEIKAGDIAVFTDATVIQSWAKTYIADALGLGLVKGVETGAFLPKGTVTRSETAVVAKRIADFVKENGGDNK
ncbi:MAG: S-layer homology domain-containing protein [Clostridia bacterium]|nr:S-layer homology domain-containing protein [Clostridia bacterium]